MRSKIQIPLVEVTADGEGVFTQIITLPADLPLGEYNFRARSDHHMVTSPTIIVWGAAVQGQEDNSIRDQSDVQLGLMPTLAPIIVPEHVSQPVAEPITSTRPLAQNSATWLIILSLTVVGFLVLMTSKMIRKH